MTARTGFILAVVIGGIGGLGFYTFNFGEGFSYFSTDPATCANCHVMQPHLDSWQKNVHHNWAKCVDCHLPHDFIPKMIAKSDNGWRHSKAFTTGDYPDPIRITPRNADILQANCVRCHSDLTWHMVTTPVGTQAHADAVSCVTCHRDVGHGAR